VNIPVWYHWGSVEERSMQNDLNLQYLQPPSEILQQAMTFLVKSPSSHDLVSDNEEITNSTPQLSALKPSDSPLLYSQQILQQAREEHIKMKPWESFFAA